MKEYLAKTEQALERWLPAESEEPTVIHKAMRYSVFAGGKRIRPLLAMAAAEAVNANPSHTADAACTLEMVHTYSLIHDDLPDMDNDDYRRGRPTCHKVFGPAMAILAGDALCTLAFQVLGSLEDVAPDVRCRLVVELATAAGTREGMIAGQVRDIEGQNQRPEASLLQSIHRAKTGALLRASVRIGAIYAGAREQELAALSSYGDHVGLAFQIVDDILDVEQPSEALGKTAGKDAAQNKITFPAVYGLEESRRMSEDELCAALRALEPFGPRAQMLRDLANLIVRRKA